MFCAILCGIGGWKDEAQRWDEYRESGRGLASFVGMIMGMVMVVGALVLEGEVWVWTERCSSYGWLRVNEVVGD